MKDQLAIELPPSNLSKMSNFLCKNVGYIGSAPSIIINFFRILKFCKNSNALAPLNCLLLMDLLVPTQAGIRPICDIMLVLEVLIIIHSKAIGHTSPDALQNLKLHPEIANDKDVVSEKRKLTRARRCYFSMNQAILFRDLAYFASAIALCDKCIFDANGVFELFKETRYCNNSFVVKENLLICFEAAKSVAKFLKVLHNDKLQGIIDKKVKEYSKSGLISEDDILCRASPSVINAGPIKSCITSSAQLYSLYCKVCRAVKIINKATRHFSCLMSGNSSSIAYQEL